MTIPKFNQNQLVFLTLVFFVIFSIYNALLCGSFWCACKYKEHYGTPAYESKEPDHQYISNWSEKFKFGYHL